MGNRGDYTYIVFLKSQGLLTVLAKLLLNLGEMPEVIEAMVTAKGLCEVEKLKVSGKPLKQTDINCLVDQRVNFSGEGYNVDLIFGKDRVFFIAYMLSEKRKTMVNLVTKTCLFIKPTSVSQSGKTFRKMSGGNYRRV